MKNKRTTKKQLKNKRKNSITSKIYKQFKRTTPDPYNNVSGETQFTLNGFSDIDRRTSDRGSRFISDSGDSHPGSVIYE